MVLLGRDDDIGAEGRHADGVWHSHHQACSATSGRPVSAAWAKANSRAARPDVEPSTPTTTGRSSSGCVPAGTTTTGQLAWAATCGAVAPSSSSPSRRCRRPPTTTRSACSDAWSSAAAAPDREVMVRNVVAGARVAAWLSAAASSALAGSSGQSFIMGTSGVGPIAAPEASTPTTSALRLPASSSAQSNAAYATSDPSMPTTMVVPFLLSRDVLIATSCVVSLSGVGWVLSKAWPSWVMPRTPDTPAASADADARSCAPSVPATCATPSTTWTDQPVRPRSAKMSRTLRSTSRSGWASARTTSLRLTTPTSRPLRSTGRIRQALSDRLRATSRTSVASRVVRGRGVITSSTRSGKRNAPEHLRAEVRPGVRGDRVPEDVPLGDDANQRTARVDDGQAGDATGRS